MRYVISSYLANMPDLVKFKNLFYLGTPNSTFTEYHDSNYYQSLFDDIHGWFLFFIIMENFYLAYHGSYLEFTLWQDSFTSIGCGIMESTLRIFTRSIEFKFYAYIFDNYHLMNLPLESWITWIVSFLAIDFMYYWFHRMAHSSMILWSFHQIHHSSNFMNFTSSLRLSLFEHAFIAPLYYAPCMLFLPPEVPLAHAYLNLLYQFWIHTELINTIGPLEHVLNTASHHRVHHGRNEYCIDKNYGGVLIIWDRIFGTFEKEKAEQPVAYGLVEPLESFDVFYAQFFYFWKCLWQKPSNMNGLTNKIKSVFMGPGWHPEGDYPIPEINYPIEKYSPHFPNWKIIYALAHVVYLGEIYMVLFHYDQSKLLLELQLKLASFLFLSVISLGFFIDENRFWSPVSEFIRTLIILTSSCFSRLVEAGVENDFYKLYHFSLFYGSLALWVFYYIEVFFVKNNQIKLLIEG